MSHRHAATASHADHQANATVAALPPPVVERWLAGMWWMVLAMVVIGGITRLTGSGLSMTEWEPLIGAIPPLTEADWLEVFARYRRTPQYVQVNHWMELADFQRIFFWEYLHRLWGRLLGLAFALPWLALLLRGALPGVWAWRTGVALALGGAQGALGWYMVQSGLVEVPEVSHFRLAAHLGLAFAVACWLHWCLLELRAARALGAAVAPRPSVAGLPTWATAATGGLLAVQIVYGAFMAGTRAGTIYPTFPDMHGSYWPEAWRGDASPWHALVHHPVAIHAAHRTLAWVVALALGALAFVAVRRAHSAGQRRAALALAAALALQLTLGAGTVMTGVHIGWAVAHQAMALVLLARWLVVAHAFGARQTAAVRGAAGGSEEPAASGYRLASSSSAHFLPSSAVSPSDL